MRLAALTLLSGVVAGCEAEAPKEVGPAYVVDDSWRGIDRQLLDASLPAITEGFFDPSSVQLQKLMLPTKPLATLCGEVNAKNRMGGYVGFRPFFILIGVDEKPPKAFVLDPDPEDPTRLVLEASMIMVCPAWSEFASEAAGDTAFFAEFPKEDIPASISGFCRASEIKLTDVNRCIGSQLRASIAAKGMLEEGSVTQVQYETCLRKADRAGGYSNLKDVEACMRARDFDASSLDLKGQAPDYL
jgi:hypothetical protein